jgi:hypothetical protein
MKERRNPHWRQKAHQVLDQFERGAGRGKLTQLTLAKACGVARQTLWRDKDLMQRFHGLAKPKGSAPSTKVGRASAVMQIRSLRVRIDELELVNARLTQNLLVLTRVLDEHGLDVVKLMGMTAPDLAGGKKFADWAQDS